MSSDLRPFRLVADLSQDVRYGVRQLHRSAGFVVVAVVTLALGIGANTALFSLLDAALLKRLPVASPEQLVSVIVTTRGGGWMSNVPAAIFDELRSAPRSFSGVFAFWHDTGDFRLDGDTEPAAIQLVSGDYYSTLGISPFRGRVIGRQDQAGAGTPVAVLGYGFWMRRFRADPTVLGRTVFVDGEPRTIVGVTPPAFFGTDRAASPDLTIPLGESHRLANLWVIGRRKAGVSLESARAETEVAWQRAAERLRPRLGRLRKSDRDEILSQRADLIPADKRSGSMGLEPQVAPLRVLAILSAVVLLIGCANIANLLLSRSAARADEISTRLALGASRGRIVRQLLVESGLLSLLGAICGLGVGFWAHKVLVAFLFGEIVPTGISFSLDLHLLAFTLAVSVVTTLLFGLAPALRTTRSAALRPSGRGIASGTRRWRFGLGKALLVAQVSACVLLLAAGVLLARTVGNLRGLDRGFAADNLLLVRIGTGDTRLEGARVQALYRSLITRARGLPGVSSASLAARPVFGPNRWTKSIWVQGRSPDENQTASFNTVAPGFFDATGMQLLSGRDFTVHDRIETARVAIVNETFARRYCPHASALGCRFGSQGPSSAGTYEVIGIVKDAKYRSLRETPEPAFYEALLQDERVSPVTLHVRAQGDARLIAIQLREIVRAEYPDAPVYAARTVGQFIDNSLRRDRMMAVLSAFFASLALLLTTIGLFGTVAYSVERRTQEIGVRLALGARYSNVLRLVMGETVSLAIAGAAAGVMFALVSARALESFVFGLSPSDPRTLAGVVLVLVSVASIAAYVPARRAARLDPMTALRHD